MSQNSWSPLVSVIMPAYNAAHFVEEAIASVQAQTVTDWELLVIDDGSRDATCEIVENCASCDSRIKFLRNGSNLGVAATRNRGIDLAKGKYIAFLDSDDRWHRRKLEKQIHRLESRNAGIAYCSYGIIDAKGNRCRANYLVPETVSFESLQKENCMQCSAMLIRRDILKQIPFKTSYYHEDFILGLDILKAGYRAAGCPEILLDWRYIANSRSFDKKRSARNRWKIYRDYLKLPFLRSAWVFSCYTAAGLRKYLARS